MDKQVRPFGMRDKSGICLAISEMILLLSYHRLSC